MATACRRQLALSQACLTGGQRFWVRQTRGETYVARDLIVAGGGGSRSTVCTDDDEYRVSGFDGQTQRSRQANRVNAESAGLGPRCRHHQHP